MRLDLCTWQEVDAYLADSNGIILPTGSTEQHGPVGLIGTDALVATRISEIAAGECGALVAPAIAFTPAPFNTGFSGTISISRTLFADLVQEVVNCLSGQGFRRFFFLNGHGANIEPLRSVKVDEDAGILVRSWWDYPEVNTLRDSYYGDWEGMHATPSEIAITQVDHRQVPLTAKAMQPPEKLDADYIRKHSGDRHGSPDAHRKTFPDGRVGSHSALARPEQGKELLETAARLVADEYARFVAR